MEIRKEKDMKCGHCGEMIFRFEIWLRASNEMPIHNFSVNDGKLVCSPHKPLLELVGETAEDIKAQLVS